MVWKFTLDPLGVTVYYRQAVGLKRSLGAAEVISFESHMFLKQLVQTE